MPTPPSGKIVARPMVARSCGHQQEFQHYEVDKFRAQRLAKFQSTRCPDCVAKLLEEQSKTVPLSQADALKAIPAGAQVTLTRLADGWAGKLLIDGFEVETTGQGGAGPQAVVAALARLWLAQTEEVAE